MEPNPLTQFTDQQTILLTTWRRDGTPVGTPVSIAVAGGRAYVRTYGRAGKVKRLRRRPEAEVRASTVRGRPTGPPVAVGVRFLDGEEAETASAALARKHPLLHGTLVPLAHRLRHERTVHLELVPGGAR